METDLSHIENRQHIRSLLWRIFQFVAPQILPYQAWYKFEDFHILLPRMPDVIPEFLFIYSVYDPEFMRIKAEFRVDQVDLVN